MTDPINLSKINEVSQMNIFKHCEADFWWQVTPVLPLNSSTRDYYTLRRLWGDHTMNTSRRGRGYYHWGSEDNLTPGPFQIWAIFANAEAVRPLLEAARVPLVGRLHSVSWAYACEEEIDTGRYPGVTGRFLIPDVVLFFEDDAGNGILSFEVKKPNVKPVIKDADKLRAYTRLRSMEHIDRRYATFLLGRCHAVSARELALDLPVITWEDMRMLQLAAAETLRHGDACRVHSWIDRAYSRYGIGNAPAPASVDNTGHGTATSVGAIDQVTKDDRVRNFLKGSETVEAFLSGQKVQPPLDWLLSVPTRKYLSENKAQKTEDRRLNRWHPAWRAAQERALP